MAGSPSLSLQSARREARRFGDLRFSKGTMVGSKRRWSPPSTRIARRLNGLARARAPSADRRQPLVECSQLAVSQSFVLPSGLERHLAFVLWRIDRAF